MRIGNKTLISLSKLFAYIIASFDIMMKLISLESSSIRLNSEQVVDMFLRDSVVNPGIPSGHSDVIPMSTHLPTVAPRTAQPRRLSRLDSEQAVDLYLMDTSSSLAASPLSGASEPPATNADAYEPLHGFSSDPAPTDLPPAVPAHPLPPEDVRRIP